VCAYADLPWPAELEQSELHVPVLQRFAIIINIISTLAISVHICLDPKSLKWTANNMMLYYKSENIKRNNIDNKKKIF